MIIERMLNMQRKNYKRWSST